MTTQPAGGQPPRRPYSPQHYRSRHWAGPPGGLRAADQAYARHEIKSIWREVCVGSHLARRLLPTGSTWAPPRIGRITLGPPTTFTVELRPGQSGQDIDDAAPHLAQAYGVADVYVTDLVRGWVTIELIEDVGALIAPADPIDPTDPLDPTDDPNRSGSPKPDATVVPFPAPAEPPPPQLPAAHTGTGR